MLAFVLALLLLSAQATVLGTNAVPRTASELSFHDELLLTDSDSGDVSKNAVVLNQCLNVCNSQAATCRDGATCAAKFRPNEDFLGACQAVLTSCGVRCNENSNKVLQCFGQCDASDGYCKTTALCAEKSGKVGFTEICTANYASCNQACEETLAPKYGAFPTGGAGGAVLNSCFAVFTSSGSFTPASATQQLNVLMIGGGSGGAGGHQAGGASGLLKVFSAVGNAAAIPISIGAGGAGAAAANDNSQFAATVGGQTCFGSTCIGGGGVVAAMNGAGGLGGSGGGGSGNAGLGAVGGSAGSAGANGNQLGGPGQGTAVWQEIFNFANGLFVKGVGLAAGKGGAGGVSSHGGGGGGGGIIVNGQTPIAASGADAVRSGKGGEGFGAGGGAGGYHQDAAVRVAGGAGNSGIVVVNWC
jgi:hypothetical protein